MIFFFSYGSVISCNEAYFQCRDLGGLKQWDCVSAINFSRRFALRDDIPAQGEGEGLKDLGFVDRWNSIQWPDTVATRSDVKKQS